MTAFYLTSALVYNDESGSLGTSQASLAAGIYQSHRLPIQRLPYGNLLLRVADAVSVGGLLDAVVGGETRSECFQFGDG